MRVTDIANFKAVFDASTQGMATGLRAGTQSMRNMAEEAEDLTRELRQVPNDVDVDVDIDTLGGTEKLRAWILQEKAKLVHALDVDVDVDMMEAKRKLFRLEADLKRLDRMDVKPEVHVDVDKRGLQSMGLLGAQLTAMTSTLRGLPPQALAAAAAIAALGAAAVAPAIAIGVAGGAILGLLSVYESVEDSQRRFSVVFGKQAGTMTKYVDDLTGVVGKSRSDLLAITAATQDILIPQGFSRSDASDMTREITTRAAALAEWGGVDIETASKAITNGLLGEREMLKGLGIQIKQKAVDERSASLASQDAYKGYSKQQLDTIATLQLVKEQSTDAFDSFNDGAVTARRTLNKLKGGLSNIKDALAETFGAAALDLAGSLGLGGAGDEMKDFATTIRENYAAIRDWLFETIAAITGFASTASRGLAIFFDAAAWAFSSMILPIRLLIKGLSGIARFLGQDDTADWLDSVDSTMGDFVDTLGAISNGLTGVSDKTDEITTKIRTAKESGAFVAEIKTAFARKDWDEVREMTKELTKKETKTILAELPKENLTKQEKKFKRLLRKRIAKINADAETGKAEKDLTRTEKKKRTAKIDTKANVSGANAAIDRWLNTYRSFDVHAKVIEPGGGSGGGGGGPWGPDDGLKSLVPGGGGNTTVILDGYRVATAIAERTSIQHREVWV